MPVLLALLQGGDRWVAEERPARRHGPDEHVLDAELVCRTRGEPVGDALPRHGPHRV